MIVLCWNCRGLGHPATVQTLRELCNSHRPTVLFLSELKIDNFPRIQQIALSLKFDKLHVMLAKGSSGGIAIFWKNLIDLQIVASTDHYISALILNDPLAAPWMFTGVYGPMNPILKPGFWAELAIIGQNFDGAWVVASDFNAILEQKYKLGGKPFTSGSFCRFRNFMDECELLDIGYVGYMYTWNNRRAGKANIQERLDRAVSNSKWRVLFPHATVHHLSAIHSDQ